MRIRDAESSARDTRKRSTGKLMALVVATLTLASMTGRSPLASAEEPLSRYFPSSDLIGLFEADGLDAHSEAWQRSAAYHLLNETKLGILVEDLAVQAVEALQQSTPPLQRIKADDALAIAKGVARNGFALGVFGKAPRETRTVVVLRNGNRLELRRLFDKSMLVVQADPGAAKPQPITKGARTLTPMGNDGVWWAEKDDLVLTSKDAADEVIAVIDGHKPGASGHPLRTELAKSRNGVEPLTHGFLDLSALPPLPPDAVRLGLDGLKRIEIVGGFQDEALMTTVRFVAPSPRQGLLALLDQPRFDVSSLPPIPVGLPAFAALSVDMAATYDRIVALVKANEPRGEEQIATIERQLSEQFGINLRDGLLRRIGPKIALYAQPVGPPAEGNALAAMVTPYMGLTLATEAREQEDLGKQLEAVMRLVNTAMAKQRPGGAEPPEFHKKDGPRFEYVLEFPPGSTPEGPLSLLSPTLALDGAQMVISGTRSAAGKAVALASAPAGARWSPTDAFLPMAKRLPGNLVALIVSDPRETMPVLIQNLPAIAQAFNAQLAQGRPGNPNAPRAFEIRVDESKLPAADDLRRFLFPASTALSVDAEGFSLIQREALTSITSPTSSGVLVALLLPAVQSAREAARRAQCVNNLKQIMLAMHNYCSANNNFPGDIEDKDGKPLLSWRVAILPYLEQQELYNKFKLDEPWDSPNNKPLIQEMPKLFTCPSRTKIEPSSTHYRGFQGGGAMFEKGKGVGLAEVTDGTSNTIMVVEADEAVTWTKPEGLPFDPNAEPSMYGASSTHPGGLNCGFCDGSVRFIKNSINKAVFKVLITRAGGEVVSSDSY